MTTPSTPTSPLPTRQQLDEIDALLNRMLTLPSLTGDAAPPPTTTFPATSPVSETRIREIPAPGPSAAEDPVVKSWRVEWPKPQPAAPPSVAAWGSPVSAAPSELPPWATTIAPAIQPPPTPPPSQASSPPFAVPVITPQPQQSVTSSPPLALSAESKGLSLWIALLKVINGIFDIVCLIMGPLGTWMRGPGRNAIGWLGIAMIIAAAVWAFAEWSGYQWPRPDLSRFGISR